MVNYIFSFIATAILEQENLFVIVIAALIR